MKKCMHCNKEFEDDKKFCPKCGNPLTSVAVFSAGKAVEPVASDENLCAGERAVISPPAAPRKRRKLAVIGLAAGALLLLGVVPLSGIALLIIFLAIFVVWLIKSRK